MTRTVLIVAALALAGCEVVSRPSGFDQADIAYFRDPRTGLCFAATSSTGYGGYKSRSIASVPCSPEVLALVGK